MRIINQRIVSAIIVSRDGKILMGQKPPHRSAVYPDCWHIPGGGVDAGETDEKALKREILEETGIDISAYDVVLADDQGAGEGVRTLPDGEQVLAKMHFFVYRVLADKDAADITTTENDDLEGLRWFSVDELSSVKLTPPSIKLFGRLGYLR